MRGRGLLRDTAIRQVPAVEQRPESLTAEDAEALATPADCGATVPRPLAYVPPGSAAASAAGGTP